jgi:alpha-L-fucosidase
MIQTTFRKLLLGCFFAALLSAFSVRAEGTNPVSIPMVIVNTSKEPIAKGKFEPTWDSLKQYQVPEWFRDAKFGIWAHWGPQCQPEDGDWYARNMYLTNTAQGKFHAANYGSPKEIGFKDVIHRWQAQNWDPKKLMALYKSAGAQYFFALANHHDNFDNWDSKYQPWNSVDVGPRKNLIGGWAKAARDEGLRFGVSVHASHAWTWYEPSQEYDGNLTLTNGKFLWWEGLDPQELYAQHHAKSEDSSKNHTGHLQWVWGGGASLPDQAYCDKYYNRTVDLINKYHPDLIYFDDTALPLWPASDAGLKIAAHYYNSSSQLNKGRNEAVLFGKVLDAEQRKCMVWDIERGASPEIEPLPWQTDTCIGQWHYQRQLFNNHHYKTTKTVIQTLCDVVSKNGNLLLNVPLRGDGTIDTDEQEVVEGIAKWMAVNRQCIFGTRPWKKCGEGPALESAAPLTREGFNEGKGKPYTVEDFRYTTKGNILYVIQFGRPASAIHLKLLGTNANLFNGNIHRIQLLGGDKKLAWNQTKDALEIAAPVKAPNDFAIVYKITLESSFWKRWFGKN